MVCLTKVYYFWCLWYSYFELLDFFSFFESSQAKPGAINVIGKLLRRILLYYDNLGYCVYKLNSDKKMHPLDSMD